MKCFNIPTWLLLGMLCSLLAAGCSGRQQTAMKWTPVPQARDINNVPKPSTSSAPIAASLNPDLFLPYSPDVYRIQPGDLLEVSVFGQPETIAHEIPVAPDGKIYYYFLDGVPAAGLTTAEVATSIESQIGNLFTNPQVSILPKRQSDSNYVVLGKVEKPGYYPLNSSVTLREAIIEAGGTTTAMMHGKMTSTASLRNSFLVRNGQRVPVDFERLMTDQGSKQDIYVRPGDYIYVASALKTWIYLTGEVHETAAVPFCDGLTLLGVMTSGEGGGNSYTDEACLSRVVVVRGSLMNPQNYEVDLQAILDGKATDLYLQPGDIVYVTPKRFRWAKDLARAGIEVFLRSFGGQAGEHYGERHWMAN